MVRIQRIDRLLSLSAVIFEFVYSLPGGLLMPAFMRAGCRMFDMMTGFSIAGEPAKGTRATGFMVMGTFIGIGAATGLVVGLISNQAG